MQISNVSNVNAVYSAPTAAKAPAPQDASSSQATDTVHLSAAALGKAGGQDADGDNDGH
jgi:hypothetical protein